MPHYHFWLGMAVGVTLIVFGLIQLVFYKNVPQDQLPKRLRYSGAAVFSAFFVLTSCKGLV